MQLLQIPDPELYWPEIKFKSPKGHSKTQPELSDNNKYPLIQVVQYMYEVQLLQNL